MKAIIIEDEAANARKLARLLEAENIEIITTLTSVEESRKWLDDHSLPDLFFMDIELNDGLVFDLFDTHEIKKPIIFTTAYNQYALEAFKHHSIDYLLKPISTEKLRHSLDKYEVLSNYPNSSEMKLIGDLIKNKLTKSYKNRFSIKIGPRLKWIPNEEIVCFYSEQKNTYLYTDSERSFPVDYTLDNLESILDPQDFFRINRKYLIQLKSIEDILRLSNNKWKVSLRNYKREELIISRERLRDFKIWLG